jgi:four helix bundle protein
MQKMKKQELQNRTEKFALRIITIGESLPDNLTGGIIAKQIIRAGTAVAENYRASCKAKSTAEYISKLHAVVEACEKTEFCLEMIIETNLIKENKIKDLQNEANELSSIFIATLKSLKKKG